MRRLISMKPFIVSVLFCLFISAVNAQNFTIQSNATEICGPGQILLEVVSPQAGVTYTWYKQIPAWSFGGSITTIGVGTTVQISQTAYYSCFATTATTTETSNILALRVLPHTGMIISYNETNTCYNQADLAVPDLYISGGDQVQWYKNNVPISGATLQYYSATITGYYKFSVTSYCGGTLPPAFSDSVLITIAPATISPSGSVNICSGSNIILSANTGAGLTYQWRKNQMPISGATSSTYTTNSFGSYSVDVIHSPSCASTSTSVTVNVLQSPTATVSPSGPFNLCNGHQQFLSVNNVSGATYQWKNNGVPISGATSSGYGATATGNYSVTMTNMCGSSTSAVVAVTVSGPSAVTIPTGSIHLCNGAGILLNANTGPGLTYQWYKFPGTVVLSTSSSYNATAAGSYTVRVTDANGCSAVSNNVVISTATSPPATITPVGPTTVCSGNVVLNANTGTGLTYQWKNNGTNIAGATLASYTATASGSYTVAVTATGGCSATSAATAVTIGAMSATLTPAGPTSICAGTAITMSATAGTGYTYKWYRNNVLLSSTTPTYATTSGGTYKCVVTSGTCSATSNSVVVTQITNPTPTVTYNSPLSFCSPGSVTLTANTFAGVTYQWENNSVPIAGATSHNYIATGPGLYRCMETANGCSRYTGKVSVSAATSAVAAISTNDPTTLCSGGTVNMTVSNPIPGYSYQWKKNTVVIAGATATSYAATATGSYTVTATALCGTSTSNAIAVSIGSFAAQVTPSGNVAMCTGGSLSLTANTGTGFTYQWKKNNVNIAGATGATYSVTTAGSYTVSMTSPCGNGTSAATVVSQNTVTASLMPSGTSTVCSGTSQTFTANAGTGYTYRWYRNNVLLSAITPTYTTTSDGSYKVEVSISGSCALLSNTAVLTVINNPTPTITASGPTTFCAGGSVTFTANTFAGVVYQWQKNSVNIAGATNQTYTATTAGTYRANETANGCSKFTPKKAVTVNCRLGNDGEEISSDETNNIITMEVYPNPFADKLNINITSHTTEQAEIKVMDVLGKIQHSQLITTNSATELNTQLPAGVYMITTIIDGDMRTVRVVKTK